jgi:hypothetical protein
MLFIPEKKLSSPEKDLLLGTESLGGRPIGVLIFGLPSRKRRGLIELRSRSGQEKGTSISG